MEVPYYLAPTSVEEKKPGVDLSWTFDYQYPPDATYNLNTSNTWTDFSEGAKKIAGNVFDVASYIPSKILGAADSVTDKISDKVFGTIDSVLMRMLLIFAVVVIGFFILIKVLGSSGVLKDVVGLM